MECNSTWFLAILANFIFLHTQGKVPRRDWVIISVEKRKICANKGHILTLRCTLSIQQRKESFKNWTLTWRTDGMNLRENVTEQWKNSSHLSANVKIHTSWSGNKLFRCVASRNGSRNAKTFINSSTLVKVTTPTPCEMIGFRLVERPLVDSLELYWRPVTSSKNLVYLLNVCTEPYGLSMTELCASYSAIRITNSSCYQREKDVYNVPNTKGFTCMATNFGLTLYDFRAYISSKLDGDNCENKCSTERRYYLSTFQEPYPEPDITEVVLIPTSITNLRVIARVPREVSLAWSASSFVHYTESRTYTVTYKCSNDSAWVSKGSIITPKLLLNNDSFQNYLPYDQCQFCVTARAFQFYGLDSNPVCKSIRLSEESPSRAPDISCPKNYCQSTRDGHTRNVSIAWSLPPPQNWNGVITEVRIYYDNGVEKSPREQNIVKIPVRHNTTNRATLLKRLLINRTYSITMVACNKAGCSAPGKPFILPPYPLPTLPPEGRSAALQTNKLVFITCAVAVLLAAYLTYVVYSSLQRRKRLPPKIDIKLSEPSGYTIIENGLRLEYDVLVVSNVLPYVS